MSLGGVSVFVREGRRTHPTSAKRRRFALEARAAVINKQMCPFIKPKYLSSPTGGKACLSAFSKENKDKRCIDSSKGWLSVKVYWRDTCGLKAFNNPLSGDTLRMRVPL